MSAIKDLLGDVFTEDQVDKLVKVSELEDAKLAQRLSEMGIVDAATDEIIPPDPAYVRHQNRIKAVKRIWDANGRVPNRGNTVTFKELLEKDLKLAADNQTSYDQPLLIPQVISQYAREAIEPNLVLTSLLTKIGYSGAPSITFPAYGALAQAADLGEGQEYPETSLEMAGTVVCTIGKSGIAVKITEENIRYSQFDIMAMNLRAAGVALARHKEQKVADLISNNATLLYSNTDTSVASTTGRSATGAYNGTLTLNDLFKGWAQMMNSGYVPDTIIMNPFGWMIFAQEPIARLFGFQHAGQLWQQLQGSVGNVPQWSGTNPLSRLTIPTAPQNVASTFTNVPTLFPSTFNIIVTPWVSYDATNNRTDFYLCQKSELGFLIVDEEVNTESWKDPSKDIYKTKLRERYGLAASPNGGGIGKFQAVSLSRAFDFGETISAYIPVTGHSLDMSSDETYSGSPY